MRRKAFALVAVLALVACGAAYAATGPDTFTSSVSAKATGSKHKPKPVKIVQTMKIKNKTAGNHAIPAVLVNVLTGDSKTHVKSSMPKCTAAKINAAGNNSGKWNKVCSSKSVLGTGKVTATLYTAQQTSSKAVACKGLGLHVYNAGKGKLSFFLTIANPSSCDGLSTGAAQAWTATYKNEKGGVDLNIPIPADASVNAGGSGLWTAIDTQTLTLSSKFSESTGCKKGKRSYTYTVGSTDKQSSAEGNQVVKPEYKKTLKGSSKC